MQYLLSEEEFGKLKGKTRALEQNKNVLRSIMKKASELAESGGCPKKSGFNCKDCVIGKISPDHYVCLAGISREYSK